MVFSRSLSRLRKTRIISLLIAGMAAFAVALAAGEPSIGSRDCATCHRLIADEWRGSLHASAYSDPVFAGERERFDCSGRSGCTCHAPARVAGDFIGRVPPMREDGLQHGVDCISCHVDSAMVVWSGGEEMYVPHWTRSDPRYAEGVFCAGCHRWAGGDPADCRACHMPDAEGPAAAGPHLDNPADAVHSSHAWHVSGDPDMLSRGALLEAATVPDGRLRVEVANTVGAHAFPVNGHHEARVVLTGARGTVLWQREIRLAADSTVTFLIDSVAARRCELRFHIAPAVWPDSFHLLRSIELE